MGQPAARQESDYSVSRPADPTCDDSPAAQTWNSEDFTNALTHEANRITKSSAISILPDCRIDFGLEDTNRQTRHESKPETSPHLILTDSSPKGYFPSPFGHIDLNEQTGEGEMRVRTGAGPDTVIKFSRDGDGTWRGKTESGHDIELKYDKNGDIHWKLGPMTMHIHKNGDAEMVTELPDGRKVYVAVDQRHGRITMTDENGKAHKLKQNDDGTLTYTDEHGKSIRIRLAADGSFEEVPPK